MYWLNANKDESGKRDETKKPYKITEAQKIENESKIETYKHSWRYYLCEP